MEECDSLDAGVTEFQCQASEAASQDDEDEVEELHNRYLTQLSCLFSYEVGNSIGLELKKKPL